MKLKSFFAIEVSTSELLIANLKDIIVDALKKEDVEVLQIEETYLFSFKDGKTNLQKVEA